jgi:hypothetical protein
MYIATRSDSCCTAGPRFRQLHATRLTQNQHTESRWPSHHSKDCVLDLNARCAVNQKVTVLATGIRSCQLGKVARVTVLPEHVLSRDNDQETHNCVGQVHDVIAVHPPEACLEFAEGVFDRL